MMALLVNGERDQKRGHQKERKKKKKKKRRRKKKAKKNRNEKSKVKKRTDRHGTGRRKERVLSQVWNWNGWRGMTADSSGRGWNSGMLIVRS